MTARGKGRLQIAEAEAEAQALSDLELGQRLTVMADEPDWWGVAGRRALLQEAADRLIP